MEYSLAATRRQPIDNTAHRIHMQNKRDNKGQTDSCIFLQLFHIGLGFMIAIVIHFIQIIFLLLFIDVDRGAPYLLDTW